jgi:hypothetical protein
MGRATKSEIWSPLEFDALSKNWISRPLILVRLKFPPSHIRRNSSSIELSSFFPRRSNMQYYAICCAFGLTSFGKKPVKTLKTKLQTYLIGIVGRLVSAIQPFLVNHRRNYSEFRFLDQRVQVGMEAITLLFVLEKLERHLLLPYHPLVKHHRVVTEPAKLQSLKIGHCMCDIAFFFEYAECQYKYRVMRRDMRKIVVPAFIDIDNVVTKHAPDPVQSARE